MPVGKIADGRSIGNGAPSKEKLINDISRQSTQEANTAANESNKSNGQKYSIAVNLAREQLGGDTTDENLFRETIDRNFEQLEPTDGVTGSDMRNENQFTEFVRGLRDGINGFNNFIGNGMDAAWDTVIGGGLGLINKDAGDVARNMFTGEDLAVIPDIAEDIALSFIPYAGIPLTVAKNAVQQSENIAEAMSGRDDITRERLADGQSGMKGLTAAIGTTVSAIPGFGKTVNLIKPLAQNGAEQVGKQAAKETAANVAKEASTEAGEKAAKGTLKDTVSDVIDKGKHPVKTVKEAIDNLKIINDFKNLKENFKNANDFREKAKTILKDAGLPVLSSGGKTAANIATPIVALSAETGLPPEEVIGELAKQKSSLTGLMPSLLPAGTKQLSRILPGLRGKPQTKKISDAAFVASRAAGQANELSDEYTTIGDAISPTDLIERIRNSNKAEG